MLEDPPPTYAFEISPTGIAFARRQKQGQQMDFHPLGENVLAISPLKDNVVQPEEFFEEIRAMTPPNGKSRRPAALILPDYCARVAVLDFDNFPSDKEEQLSLVRFRMKKSIPFDMESARVSYHLQSGGGSKNYEVVAAAVALDIVARYEAAFRNAGFEPGYVTTSSLAALSLVGGEGIRVLAKLSGPALSVAVTEGGFLRLLRCVELPDVSPNEVSAVLFPTLAYVEDQSGQRPSSILSCGFSGLDEVVAEIEEAGSGVAVKPLRSRLGLPDQTNAGLLGFLEATAD